jgi:hypothetical protein
MTVTKNEFGQMNMFAKEPTMWMSEEDIERYGFEPYAEKAEKMNGRGRCSVLLLVLFLMLSLATSSSGSSEG